MKYFVLEISTGDSKIAGKSVYEYDTADAAIAAWHQKLATAMRSEMYETELVMVVNDHGAVIKAERYERPVEE